MSDDPSPPLAVEIHVSRSKGLTRCAIWAVVAFVLSVATMTAFRSVDWSFSAISSRLVNASMAAIALPIAGAAAATALASLRWLALALWPGREGVFADPEVLYLRLGPFGSAKHTARELIVRYPFELVDVEEDAGFEAFLPVEEQMAAFLPRIEERASHRRVDRVILRFAEGTEREVAGALRGIIAVWRADAVEQPRSADAP